MDFQNSYQWQPNGYVSSEDERAQNNAQLNVFQVNQYYSYTFPFDGRQNGDEHFGGETFQYIPTEIQVGAAIALRNMIEARELPVQSNDPGTNQLIQALYKSASQFWENIRNNSGTGW